ncbi:hypothetical protein IV203_032271 [Nitzschia inconspicua]|uniref:Uncharacterized protein n=1 Tax=Nitzschia inconspicua TaxID=303405 RepID=A0A9K3PEV8_9STRA|nr:hypothetical protein IV203_032271 [Nitzschia inconspicua]
MRFSIAAAAVLATVNSTNASVVETTKSQNRALWDEKGGGRLIQNLVHHRFNAFQHRKATAISKRSCLVNINTAQECIPNYQQQHQDGEQADVGILSICGSHQYCKEHPNSTLGGFCVDNQDGNVSRTNQPTPNRNGRKNDHLSNNRNLQINNRPTWDEIGINFCNSDEMSCSICSYGDNITEWVFDCDTAIGFCLADDVNSWCTEESCYGFEIFIQTNDTSQVYITCTTVITPVQLEYCYTTAWMAGELSCELTINGETCNSCNAMQFQNGSFAGIEYDCQNTYVPVSGNTYDSPLIQTKLVKRAIQEGIIQCDAGCALCRVGGIIGNPNAIVILDQGEVSCETIADWALTSSGPFADIEYCDNVTDLAGDVCGCYIPQDNADKPAVNGANSFSFSAALFSTTVASAGALMIL